jgi:flavin reductase (DIM6/NTAB) family NADH-FMN oxidoreductase RutF
LVSPEEFREILGRFVSGVTIVTTYDSQLQPHGMTVSAFSSLSLVPPLILACIDRAASMHDLLTRGHPFAVNILADAQEAFSLRFAQLDMERRFDGVPHSPGVHGAPVLADVHAVIECRVWARYEGGDHGIFVGEVLGGSVGTGDPLLYHRSDYRRVGPRG